MKQIEKKRAVLALADGTSFVGVGFGAERGRDNPAVGEVVFNTSMYGYQEILTDPSYSGQMMCFTYPHIGNVGCNAEDNESGKIHVESCIVRDLSRVASNFRSEQSLSEFLQSENVPGISGIDTRQLVTHLRDKGAQMGAIAIGDQVSVDDLVDQARSAGTMEGKDLVQVVSCSEPYAWRELPWSPQGGYKKLSQERLLTRPHVVAIDCGVKYNILRLLLDSGFRVTVVPARYEKDEILALKPDALFISNGPGDPAPLTYLVDTVKGLVGTLPIFGICLGHQILAQALGGSTYKLKFGHRGGNHPVMDLSTRKVEISVQNHGFAVDAASFGNPDLISHINLNDQTIEGLHIPEHKSFCIQYHPEASPGPHDSAYLFKRFFDNVVQ